MKMTKAKKKKLLTAGLIGGVLYMMSKPKQETIWKGTSSGIDRSKDIDRLNMDSNVGGLLNILESDDPAQWLGTE